MRLLRSLARLALFQAESPAATNFITAEPTAVPAVSWIRCYLLASHDYGVRCEPGHIFLACRRCGTRSRGVVFEEVAYGSRPRTAAAVAVRAATLDARSHDIRTSHEPAVPGPTLAPAVPLASRTWRAARVGGRALMDIHRLRSAPVVGGPTVNLCAWVSGAPARVRVHAARDPPIGSSCSLQAV